MTVADGVRVCEWQVCKLQVASLGVANDKFPPSPCHPFTPE